MAEITFTRDEPGQTFAKDEQKPSSPLDVLWAGLRGAGEGAAQTILGAAQFVNRSMPAGGMMPGAAAGQQRLMQQQTQQLGQREQAYQASPLVQQHPLAAGIGRFAGNVAATAPLAALPIGQGGLAARLGMGAMGGAMGGAAAPVAGGDYWKQKAIQIGLGAAGGAAVGGASSLLSPPVANAAGQLMSKGVELNPGATMGGMAQKAERAMRAFPFIGGLIRGGEEKSVESFDRAVVNETLAPVAQLVPNVVAPRGMKGHDLMNFMTDVKDQAYVAALRDTFFREDAQFAAEVGNLRTLVEQIPDTGEQRGFEKLYENAIAKPLGKSDNVAQPNMDGQSLQLSLRQIDRFEQANRRTHEQAADAAKELSRLVREALVRQNPQAADRLTAANQMFSMFARVRQAATRRADSEAIFKPSDLLQAVRSQDRSAGKGDFMRGDEVLQRFAEIGRGVLEPKDMPAQIHIGLFNRLYDTIAGAAASIPYRAVQALSKPGSVTETAGRVGARAAAGAGREAAEGEKSRLVSPIGP